MRKAAADVSHGDPRRRSIQHRLLHERRRTAGIDGRGEPVRLGEIDSEGQLVGYIDQHGLAWQSFADCLIAGMGHLLATAMAQPPTDPRRDIDMDAVLDDVPDDLLFEVLEEAVGQLRSEAHGR
jgi:hypothetical protein